MTGLLNQIFHSPTFMAKIIPNELLKSITNSGCYIRSLNYNYDMIEEQPILKCVIESAVRSQSEYVLQFILYDPKNIKLCHIEQPLAELEILDYSTDGYDSSMRYRMHDIENEQMDIFFRSYSISTLKTN